MRRNLALLYRQQRDERRRYVADLEQLAARLRGDATRLYGEIERAAAVLHRDGANVEAIDARRLIDRHRKLERSVAEIDGRIVEARAALAAAEHELQRYEIARRQRTRGRSGPADRRRGARPDLAAPAGDPPVSFVGGGG